MNNTSSEYSPKIALESINTNRIPLFNNNYSRLVISKVSSLPPNTASPLIKSTIKRSFTEGEIQLCKCPHVLIADDDSFQAFYYQTIFQRSMDFDSFAVTKQDFRLGLYKSGEELLEAYRKVKVCGCKSAMLIITDFNMGEKNLNGIELTSAVRKLDYKGPVMLRTSEKPSDLKREKIDIENLLEKKEINSYIEKQNHNMTKEIIGQFLKKRSC